MTMPTQADVLAWRAKRDLRTDIDGCALKLGEEAGEVLGALIKMGEGRKTINDLRMEVAQTVICAMGVAEAAGFDVFDAVADEWERCADYMLPETS